MQVATEGALPFIARNLGDSLGVPTRLRQFVAGHRDLCVPLQVPPRSVAKDNVVQWDYWSREVGSLHDRKGTFQYWGGKAPYRGASLVHREDLEHFTSETVDADWSCDIRAIVGLSASRSDLENFMTLDELAETHFPEMLHPVSEDKVRENLKRHSHYSEFSGITDAQKRSGQFCRYMWDDGRVYLANTVDMHPIIAARYIARRLQKPITLYGTLHTHSINVDAACSLTDDFDIYTMPGPSAYTAFSDAMHMFGAPFGVYGLPRRVLVGKGGKITRYLGDSSGFLNMQERNDQDVRLILLPREDELAMSVSKVFREAGLFDAGRFILETARRQAKV